LYLILQGEAPASLPDEYQRSIGVPILQVLDCISGSVIKLPPKCEYAALSYVWAEAIPISGTPIDDGDYPDINNFPQIIWDALKAALRIGILYLWVDRYRINQSDAYEKQHQIR
jgi:hypothetical protein